ncbi:MAG: hypothetical protein HY254_06185 [Burkholderiales bacterium]|nr:hypothetical protein [Burkholderiales bacterium]
MSNFDEANHRKEQKAELAGDIVGGLIAIRSAWMHDEDSKSNPDEARLAILLKEQIALELKRSTFYTLELNELDHLIQTYTLQLKTEDAERDAYLASKGGK